MNQIDLALRRFDTPGRFLLKRVKHLDFVGKLYCIDHPIRIASKRQSDFKYAGSKTAHRLSDIRLPTFRSDRQGS